VVTRRLLIFLWLGLLRTVPGCAVEPTASGTSASGGETDDETQQYRKQGGRQDAMSHLWHRPVGSNAEGGA
jgi:hypothetical protein